MFKFLEHVGDIKIKVIAKDYKELFGDVTDAVAKSVFESTAKIKEGKKKEIRTIALNAKNKEMLIHDFLEEILYIINYEHFIPCLIKADLVEKKGIFFLTATLNLFPTKPSNYKLEVKAASFDVSFSDAAKKKVFIFVLDV